MLKNIAVLLIVVVGILAFKNNTSPSSDERVHYHAGFKVYIDGVLQDYSEYQFMNFVPCSEHEKNKTPAEEQIEKAHLHDGIGDVVHIHRNGARWRDLFQNMQVNLPKDKGLRGYINGIENADIMNSPIKAYSTAIFVIGSTEISHGSEIVSEEHIREVETKSELCGT